MEAVRLSIRLSPGWGSVCLLSKVGFAGHTSLAPSRGSVGFYSAITGPFRSISGVEAVKQAVNQAVKTHRSFS